MLKNGEYQKIKKKIGGILDVTNILFVPGIKGTELFEKERKVWFPKNSGDFFSLSITNHLNYGNPLRVVNAYGLLTAEIYKGVMDEYSPEEIDFFTYDWRFDIRTHVSRLTHTIVDRARNEPVTLVAHSMGGMLAKLAIIELDKVGLSETIKKFITLGTPWHGSADAYKAIAYGEPGFFPKLYHLYHLFNDKDSRRLAIQLLSVYQLLPSEQYFNDEEGKFIISDDELNYIDVIQRVQSFYNESQCDFIDIYNGVMKPIQEAMSAPLPEGILHDCLIGISQPTIYQLPDKFGFKDRVFFKKDVIFKNGDGTVPLFSAKPAHKAELYYIEAEHHSMCSNPNVIDFINWSIRDKPAQSRPTTLITNISDKLRSGVMARIKCPIDTTFLDEEGKYLAGQFDPSIEEISPLVRESAIMYFGIGESKYVYFPERYDEDVTVNINSYETGIADISVEFLEPDDKDELQFEPLPIQKGQIATVVIPLSRRYDKASLIKEDMEFSHTLTRRANETNITPQTDLPKIGLSVKPIEGSKKAFRRPVFFGEVELLIDASQDQTRDLYFSINDGTPERYSGDTKLLHLSSGEYTVRAFGKDLAGRPLKPKELKFSIDNQEPVTILSAGIKPDVLELFFEARTAGSRPTTFYWVEGREDWLEVHEQPVYVDWGKLDLDPKKTMEIQYYSKNEFGNAETPKRVTISLGAIPVLMWDENPSVVTPEVVWHNLLKDNDFALIDFKVAFISSAIIAANYDEKTPDDAKGIRLVSDLYQFDIMYAEKYSLYFSGPPTEVLDVGQKYKFHFELLTERTKERVSNTKPRARLHAIRSQIADKQLQVIEKDGIFYSEFTVDESFLRNRYKLVITDMRNTHPPLREISLIMKGEGG